MNKNEEYKQLSFFPDAEYLQDTGEMIRKSNQLINRIGNVSLLSEKVLLYALTNIREVKPSMFEGTSEELYYQDIFRKTGTNFADGLISSFSNNAFRKQLGIFSGSYYNQIDKLMNSFLFTNSWNIIYQDKDIIGKTNLIMGTMYDKNTGKIYIKWNADVANMIINLKSNYTELNGAILYKIKSIYTFSLYQLLRSKISYLESIRKKRGEPLLKEYYVKYGLSELKFLMSVVNVDVNSKSNESQIAIKQIEAGNFENAEQAITREKETYACFSDLRKRVLSKAYKEINGFDEVKNLDDYYVLCSQNHKTDIHFRYNGIYNGPGGKAVGVEFYISWDDPTANQLIQELSDEDKDTFLDELMDNIHEPVKLKDLRSISEAANWNMEKIMKAYDVACNTNIKTSFVGFMIDAIQKGYEMPIKNENDSLPGKKNKFNDFPQREYTEDEYKNMELRLLEKSLTMHDTSDSFDSTDI